jgi:hypothetical protein
VARPAMDPPVARASTERMMGRYTAPMGERCDNEAGTPNMSRWQGQMESTLDAMDRRFGAAEQAVDKALDAAQRAVDKAERTVTSRLEGFPELYASKVELNALRDVIAEMRENRLDKESYYREHEALEKSCTRLEERIIELEKGRGEDKAVIEAMRAKGGINYTKIGLMITGVGVALAIFVAVANFLAAPGLIVLALA